jgi:hypothetical protein
MGFHRTCRVVFEGSFNHLPEGRIRGERLLSLFEPHTRVIPRHKGGAEVEFGRLVTLDEVERGLSISHPILTLLTN